MNRQGLRWYDLRTMAPEQVVINQIITQLQRAEAATVKHIKDDLKEGGDFLTTAIKSRAPIGTRVHKRYNSGKTRAAKGAGVVEATYRPGNLRRSFRVLNLRKSKNAVFVGALLGKSTDGYYAGMVESGTKYMPSRPFVAPVVQSVGPIAQRFVIRLLLRRLDNHFK